MKCNIVKKFKLWLTMALALIVVGMAMLGFLGFNKGVDYNNSYEVSVSIFAPEMEDASTKLNSSIKDYLSSNDKSYISYACQSIDDGISYIYKFSANPNIDDAKMTEYLAEKTGGLITVNSGEVVAYNSNFVLEVCISAGIILILAFVYLLIREKGACSLASVIASVASALLFIALVALLRLQVYPYLGVGIFVTGLFSLIISAVMSNRINEELANSTNSSSSNMEIAEIASRKSAVRIILITLLLVISIIVLGVAGIGNLSFVALALAVAILSSAATTFILTPILWASLKNSSKK